MLDPALRLVPPGVVGEIFIGGDGVARGYRGRPDLTAERFLPDPFGPPGSRFYRTGDLGRLLDDGRFECLGRTDHQVKVRGFRIELGEIEVALRAVPGVREVVVVSEKQCSGEPRLVAYWVGEAQREQLYERARSVLAPYMVPSAFARLEAFPLTTSGKVDRKALPAVDDLPSDSVPVLRPRNDLETHVATIWAEVLGRESVGIDQDFFALGGTSLLAIRARSRLEQELRVDIPLRAFFESPTVLGIAGWLSGNSASELRGDVTGIARNHPSAPAWDLASGAPVPLTARQSLLWLDQQLFPDARYSTLVLTLSIDGPLEPDRLRRAWAATIAGRDFLRVAVNPREASQRLLASTPPELPIVPLDSDRLGPWISERSSRPLPSDGFRWDAVLLRLAPDRHVFFLAADHILVDGLSLKLTVDDLLLRYRGVEPTPSASFGEYLAFEARYRSSEPAAQDHAYWDAKVSLGAPPLRPYGIQRTDTSAEVQVGPTALDAAQARRILALTRSPAFSSLNGSLSRLVAFATGLGAFLYRSSGSREVVLGIPFSNRDPRFARTCGLLMEQLFLRIVVEEDDTFESLARRVQADLVESLQHGQCCVSDRGMEYVTLNLLPASTPQLLGFRLEGRSTTASALAGSGSGAGDLRDTLGLQVSDSSSEDHLRFAFVFHRATYPPRVQARFQEHFVRVLDAMAEDPGARVDAVDLLGSAEREVVLRASVGPWPADAAPDLVGRIREQAERSPGHVAVEAPDETLTYGELESTTNRLARRLRSLGVLRESRVGVAVPRGARELCALLATLKAGGAYVPVDPGHPVERVRVILEDAAPEVLIAPSDSPLRDAMPPGTKLLVLDDLAAAVDGFDDRPLDEPVAPDQLAYILFTSGSTGRPKGVEVLRGGFANFLRSMAREPGLRESDRFLAITTTTFDISGLELFGPLWVGATSVIVDRQTSMDPRLLEQALAKARCSLLQATPATWRMLVDAGWEGTPGLRMLCGGEALSRDLADRLIERGAELWNVYGPTETTVWSTIDRVDPGNARITIGRPVDRTRVYVLDPALRLVPPGVVGEIFIGGDGVARGYRGRPDLTAERFLPDPFGPPGSRFYRTGDLGRLLDDGRFECLGRTDHQVKIRGFRIELGEIEVALRAVPGVREVVVVSEKQSSGEPRLLAYWVGEAQREQLYERARSVLAPYMVPSAFARLEAFPLTTSGKVDRKALPAVDDLPSDSVPVLRPRNDLETHVATIWAEVLGRESVGIDQDFFALGGTSLLAIRARSRLEQELRVDIPLRAFFESPTVLGVIAHIGKDLDATAPIAVRLRRGQPGRPPVFCLLGIHLYQDIAAALPEDVPVVGIHVPIWFRPSQADDVSIPAIGKRYREVIRRHQPHGPYHLAGFCFGGVVAFEVARQLVAEGDTVLTVSVLDSLLGRGLRVDRGGWIRTHLVRALRNPVAALSRFREKLLERRGLAGAARQAPPDVDGRVELDVNATELQEAGRRWESGLARLPIRVLVVRASQRELGAGEHVTEDLGWSPFARDLETLTVPGSHLELFKPPNATLVANAVSAAIRSGSPHPDPAPRD